MFLSRKKNRPWFSAESSRVRPGYADVRRNSDPLVVAGGVFIALIFAIITGRVIDYRRNAGGAESARFSIAPGALNDVGVQSVGPVYHLNDARFPAEPRGPVANTAVLSEISGLLIEGVSSEQRTLIPSLSPSFSLRDLYIEASLGRAGTFVEFSIGGGINGSYLLRLSSNGIVSSFLIPDGERTALESFSESILGDSISLTFKENGVVIVGGPEKRTILSGVDLRNGKVTVSSNLRARELCKVTGSWDSVENISLLTGNCAKENLNQEPKA